MVTIVCLRFYVRGHMLRVVGLDDWVIAAGAVSLPLNPQCRGILTVESIDLQRDL
jgi:hypothetical protein